MAYAPPPPAPLSLGRHHARWAIALANGRTVHLRQDFSDIYFVVHADADRLFAALRAQRGHFLDADPCPPLADLQHDPKFADVDGPMHQSADWPVPLPSLGVYHGCITFSDGMTRTRWLIHHGAASFPVAVTDDSVEALQALLGLVSTPPILAAGLAHLSPSSPA